MLVRSSMSAGTLSRVYNPTRVITQTAARGTHRVSLDYGVVDTRDRVIRYHVPQDIVQMDSYSAALLSTSMHINGMPATFQPLKEGGIKFIELEVSAADFLFLSREPFVESGNKR